MPASTDARREFLGGAAVIAIVVSLAVGKRVVRWLSDAPTPEQCETLLSRWLDHASRQQDPQVEDADVAKAEERARRKPAYLADLESCQAQLTKDEVECGIGAPNADAIERCLQ